MEICGICGGPHTSYNCDSIPLKNHVTDKSIPSKARLTLPSNFSLEFMTDGRIEVSSNEKIAKGTYFGPLDAPKLITLNPSILFPLKLFSSEIEDLQESFLDTSDENACNWLMFINPAICLEEQNMVCFQYLVFPIKTDDIND
ncbi:PR domain zinc finger protein 15-like isoform X3 [Agrilus planipennis]|uniref:PR domain zinc finger protein 15-like isoform X3 n=1 Tax=Agrilus planipennis TaxID=224129 RepID=A0A1W4X3E0_AGRPL|nr:PR domain zinc finger protein 15-like isoform X3 [Agrilus planipennis]